MYARMYDVYFIIIIYYAYIVRRVQRVGIY